MQAIFYIIFNAIFRPVVRLGQTLRACCISVGLFHFWGFEHSFSAACFFHLKFIRQSLDVRSAKTLVQAYVTSHVCNAVLAESSTRPLSRRLSHASR